MKPAGAKVTVGLAMIVKNEAVTLPRLAASLDGQLDHWTIVDTGSTDATVEVAAAVFDGVPGEVVQDEWRGYGPSRNVALSTARPHTDWVMTLDADDTFHGEMERSMPDEFDGVEAVYRVEPLRYWVPRLVRADTEWAWHGRAHEYLARTGGPSRLFRTAAFAIEHHADGGNRGRQVRAGAGAPPGRPPGQAGRSPDDVLLGPNVRGQWRADQGGDVVPQAHRAARLGRGDVVRPLAAGHLPPRRRPDRRGPDRRGLRGALERLGARPWRAEPLWSLAEHYRLTAEWALSFEACDLARRHCGVGAPEPGNGFGGDRLLVHLDVYQWRIAYEQSISAYYVGERDLGCSLVAELLARTDLPPGIVANLEENRRFYDA